MKLASFVAAAAAAGAMLFGAAAQAGTHWSVGINLPLPLPLPGVVVSNGGYYQDASPAPVYYAPVPARRYVAPDPYDEAPPVYAPPRVVYAPAPEVVYRGWYRERDARWERHREFERARWEHERREPRGDDRDARRWHRD